MLGFAKDVILSLHIVQLRMYDGIGCRACYIFVFLASRFTYALLTGVFFFLNHGRFESYVHVFL